MKTIATTKIEKVENDNNLRLWRSIERAIMKRHVLLNRVLAVGLLAVIVLVPVGQAAQAQGKQDLLPPAVFQAAGSTADSIQSTVDAFRAALDPANHNNGNNPARSTSGHREINWDGGNPNIVATTPPVTPFNTFLNTRGAQFTTPGVGLSQAPASGGPQGGLQDSSTIRPTAPSSAPSARRGCSLRWAATSLKLCSSYPAPTGLSRQR